MEESRVHYSACPVCSSGKLKPVLKAKDHTVSGKTFEIWECEDCSLRFTQNTPGSDSIGVYYQSPDYISHTDSNKGLINRLYHYVRKETLADKRRMIIGHTGVAKGTLLDIGAGTGAFVQQMQHAGWASTGLEPDAVTRQRAATIHAVELLPAEKLFDLPADSFDAITMWHVLEHVHELHSYVGQLKKILKPGGRIFIAVPNYTCYDSQVYQQYWAAYDVPRHLYHFSPKSMEKLLTVHGLKLEKIKPMWYDSFYISLLSEKYKRGNPVHALFVALLSNIRAIMGIRQCCSIIYIISR